ncbi:TRAP transporter permease [Clostridium sp. AM58-1XD]|uniref:TRAP transporter permease n=1 Tax=Clostridium sp. AM58-1XD TaxID=2292307 RepID=UPI000E47CF93|nr:TRAP transporter permease [Clostridium sp. AM58-1XD]RGY99903.1 TRAP transporter permease [Clostridium sp. AM58-1XD]
MENRKGYSWTAAVIAAIAIAACVFHLYTGMFGVLTAFKQRIVHFVLIGTIGLLYDKKGKRPSVLDMVLSFGMIVCMIYFIGNYKAFTQRNGQFTSLELFMGIWMILCVLYVTKKNLGWPIVMIALVALAYAYCGAYIPGRLGHKGFSGPRIVSHLALGTEGILGSPVGASATFVIVFVIMAALLDHSGTGDFFINSALACTGKRRGGPAKAAVLASGLFGAISGSSVANVVSTGTFTIPLMKRTGFRSDVAAAVEAVASTGGQLMPPIMGAGAFVMAEVTGIPYFTIMIAAIIPAMLYYAALFFSIDFYSAKSGFTGTPAEQLPSIKEEMRLRGHMVIALLVLIIALTMGYSPLRSGFYGTTAVVVCCFLKKSTRLSRKDFFEALVDAGKASVGCTCACACAGIIMGVMTLTGLGLKFSSIIIAFSMGSRILALVLTMLAALLLGMGLPTVASYIMLSILVAPALIDLGISKLAAHMFVFYFGLLSAITPPVAVASFAAAGIAQSPSGKTGWTAVKLGLTAFIVPYMFIYGPEILMVGKPFPIALAAVTSMIGVYFLAASTEGWGPLGKLRWYERGLFAGAALLLIIPGAVTDAAGIALGIAGLGRAFLEKRQKKIIHT